MAYIQLNLFSNSLGMQTQVEVILPQKNTVGEIGIGSGAGEGSYKTLYLLHGLSDDQSIWMRRTSIERYASEYGICVVMPCGGRSFYLDQKNGEAYYQWVAKELPARIEEFFHVSKNREDRFVAGLSMGGYGALKIALKERSTFCAGAGLSSVADIRNESWKTHLEGILGEENYFPEDHDLFYLAKEASMQENKPRIFMCCGTEDFLYQDNIKLRDYIKTLDLDYTYEESPGVHCWDYWDENIQRILKWMFDRENFKARGQV